MVDRKCIQSKVINGVSHCIRVEYLSRIWILIKLNKKKSHNFVDILFLERCCFLNNFLVSCHWPCKKLKIKNLIESKFSKEDLVLKHLTPSQKERKKLECCDKIKTWKDKQGVCDWNYANSPYKWFDARGHFH